MQFNSLAEFIAMGNHGFYVWLSYGITALLLVALVLTTKSKDKSVKLHIQKRLQREAKLKQAAKKQQQTSNKVSTSTESTS